MDNALVFPEPALPLPLVQDIRRMNPWWEGAPQKPLPSTRRHLVKNLRRRLDLKLAPSVVVRGPRQIGKTTAQLQVLSDLLDEGDPPSNILRVQCDELPELMKLSEPLLRLVDWFESAVLKMTLNAAAQAGQPTYIFLDEVQNPRDWAPQLKSLEDASSTQVVVTGSSALRIELGRDSLAGRITTIETGVLSLTEIGAFHGLGVAEPRLSDNGLEPLTQAEFWRDLVEYGDAHRADVAPAFSWFSERGGPKICLADHGLRASWLQEIVPLDPERLQQEVHLTTLAGRIAECVVGAVLLTISGLDVAHLPERPGEPEVDFVLTVGTRRVPMEVKYQRVIDELRDTEGLRSFLEQTVNNAPFGILVTQTPVRVRDPRIICIPLSSFRLVR